MTSFSNTNLEQFGKKLRYSRFVRNLDNVDDAILNNEATLQMQKRFVPSTTTASLVNILFHNAVQKSSISSTAFTYNSFIAYLDDDGVGNIRVFRYNSAKQKVAIEANAGTIDYTTGEIKINSFVVTAYDGIEIKVNADPVSKDIVPVREQIIIISTEDMEVLEENSK